MTLIVGIRCTDGVVMAADGAATYGSLGRRTIRQSTRKLEVVRDSIVVGVSGPVGLGQLITESIGELSTGGFFSPRRSPEDVMRKLREELWEDVGTALEYAQVAGGVIGNSAADSAISHTLVACWLGQGPTLIQLDQQCAPEKASDDLPFVAIGSGQSIADPFLAFLKRHFWPDDTQPTLADGKFVACWTLEHAIKTAPGGISYPYEVAVVGGASAQEATARKLAREELYEFQQHVSDVSEHLASYRDRLVGETGEEEVSPPPEP